MFVCSPAFACTLCNSSPRFVNAMVYYVIALNTGQLGGNRFVSFVLTGIVDMPSALCVCFLVKR